MAQHIETETEPVTSLEFNYKRAVTQMLILKILSVRESFITEIMDEICEQTYGVFNLSMPYGSISKLMAEGYIEDGQRRIAPDGRLRRYYKISPKGQNLLQQQMETYNSFATAVAQVLHQDTF